MPPKKKQRRTKAPATSEPKRLDWESRKYQSILNEVLKLYEENPQSMSGKAGAERILQDFIDKKKDPLLTVKKLRDKFASLHKTLIETGNPSCPEDVKRAKRVFRDMQNHAVNSQTAAELEAYNDAPPPYEGGDYDDPYELASTSQASQEGSSSQPSQEGSTPQASQSTPQSTPAAGGRTYKCFICPPARARSFTYGNHREGLATKIHAKWSRRELLPST